MNSSIYNKVLKFVISSFEENSKDAETDIKHLLRTVDYLKILLEDADEALLVAALSHDIERAYRQTDLSEKKVSAGLTSTEFYRLHEERGAEIMSKFLEEQNVDELFVKRVAYFISHHEEGGSPELDFLRDADSLSFLEVYVPLFLEKEILIIGKEKVKEKFDWMFSRIISEKAKEIARPIYEDALTKLTLL